MSTFSCDVVQLEIEKHPDADSLELAKIGDYRAVVPKNMFHSGDLGVYIPEGAVLPDPVIEKLGLTGKLSGRNKNRVKAIKLRGVLSQGLVYPIKDDTLDLPDGKTVPVKLGDDVSSELGIKKYVPEIPEGMNGVIFNFEIENALSFDVEDLKKYPDLFREGESVEITEKIHGSFCGLIIFPPDMALAFSNNLVSGRIAVFSKEIGSKGLAFMNNDLNRKNVYLRAIRPLADNLLKSFGNSEKPVYVIGEVFGKGVQDLTYGKDLSFRWFDIAIKEHGQFVWNQGSLVAKMTNIAEKTPVLYVGPFSKTLVENLTNGKESVSGSGVHMREGVVIRSLESRKMLKSVSEDYLLRKGGTEFN